jgi:serine/threonine protein kinase
MAMRPEICDPRRLDLFLRNRLPEDSERDLEAHLGVCPACRNKLDELTGGPRWWKEVRHYLGNDGASANDPSSIARAQPSAVPCDFLQPSDNASSLGRLGAYDVLEVLGRGGMGVVLKAFDPALHRPVAIKVLAAEFAANAAARKRFAREAQAAAAVIHDHVVPVHAVDADATPPYLVMAFIAGRSLQERLDQSGPLELKEILRIGMQTASGLAAAHAQGLIHRDIKPANIMLENGVERVRITDFGLARAVDDVTVTQHGMVAGTPQYMAPEQARGESLDQRADLFSLGSMIYVMATGQPPFRGDSGMAVLRQVCDSEPVPPRSLNPDIPAWLEGIVLKLHAKDPAERFQSADEIAALLEACLAHVQQPDHHPLPPLAAELGCRVPTSGPGFQFANLDSVLRRQVPWWLGAGTAAFVIGLTALIAAWRFGGWRGANPSIEEAPPAANAIAPAATGAVSFPKDEFSKEVDQVRTRLDSLGQSISGPAANAWSEVDLTAHSLQERVQSFEYQLNGEAGSTSDPVGVQIENVRQRLEKLRKSLGPN